VPTAEAAAGEKPKVSAKQLRESVSTWKFIGAFCKSSFFRGVLQKVHCPTNLQVNPDPPQADKMKKD